MVKNLAMMGIVYKYHFLFWSIVICNLSIAQDKRLQKADENFEEYAFLDARKIYLDVAENGYKSQDLYKKLADSYYFNAELPQAAPWYERLIKNYPDQIDPEYLFRYSQSLKSINRYDEADQAMERYETLSGKDQRATFFAGSRDYLKFIEMQSGRYSLQKLHINSENSDYAPSFNHKGDLVFASSRNSSKGMIKNIHEWNEMPFLDLFSSNFVETRKILKNPVRLKGKINTRFHESSTSFSKDGKTVYFTRNNYTERKLSMDNKGTTLLKLYRATLSGNKWTNIQELPFNSDEYSVAHPALSADGKKLYFASDMPGTRGLSDLYVIDVHADGSFGEPVNLGNYINTEGRETFPYVSDSGRLNFASDGHIGLGGLDVFVSVPEEGKRFSIPFNVGKPVNGPADDFTFVLDEPTKIGYFASNRKGGRGNDDIYRFKQLKNLITECNQYVTGVITDAKTRALLPNTEVILFDGNNKELQRTVSDDAARYKFDLDCETAYVVRGVRSDYAPTEAVLNTNTTPEFAFQLPLQLGKGLGLLYKKLGVTSGMDLSKALQLNPIYFDLDKSFIRPDAEIELQKIISALRKYPKLKIDVRSHTDSRAKDRYNMYLSERRAKSTMRYIIQKGKINPSRISGRGYGETALVNACSNGVACSDEEHENNRRSEFIVMTKK